MTKTEFQKELLEKIKPGVKASDLKKKGNINTQIPTPPDSPIISPIKEKDEGYESEEEMGRINFNPSQSTPQQKIKQLQKDVKFWSTTAANYLQNLQKLTAENDNLKEEIKELKGIKPTKTQQELEKALIEANQKIRDQTKTISDLDHLLKTGKNSEIIKKLEGKVEEQHKTIEELKKQVKSKEINKEPVNKSFFCDGCQLTKQGTYIKRKIDSPFEPRIHGRICYLCSACSPYFKELNDTTFDKDNNPYKLY